MNIGVKYSLLLVLMLISLPLTTHAKQFPLDALYKDRINLDSLPAEEFKEASRLAKAIFNKPTGYSTEKLFNASIFHMFLARQEDDDQMLEEAMVLCFKASMRAHRDFFQYPYLSAEREMREKERFCTFISRANMYLQPSRLDRVIKKLKAWDLTKEKYTPSWPHEHNKDKPVLEGWPSLTLWPEQRLSDEHVLEMGLELQKAVIGGFEELAVTFKKTGYIEARQYLIDYAISVFSDPDYDEKNPEVMDKINAALALVKRIESEMMVSVD